MSDCLFCKIIQGDIPGDKVYEDENYYAFNDINPQAPTHFLVVPKKHIDKISSMGKADQELIGGLFTIAARICKQKSISDFRLVINNGAGVGQSVFHIHLHVLAGRAMGWPPG
ncbi:MAG: histidine triad nucleotide-binding protein [Proteobacteria bacterium]|nr:histidine triad nucleotide-binding protein [Pseudomonadota bacterium]